MSDRAPFALALALIFTFALVARPAWGQSSSSSFTLQVQRVGAGGGSASSASFAVDATTGQAAVGPSSGASYRVGLGFIYLLDPANSPLPVELTRFEATVDGRSVQLRWQTASETNNAGFRVEHRWPAEGGWTELGFVESTATGGTTTEPQSYRYTAEDLAVGTHTFRLTQVDLSGAAHRHDPVTIELQMQEALRLSAPAPNPVSGTATLRFAVKEQGEATIRLFDTLGQQVATVHEGTPQAGEQQTTQVDVSSLPSGTYFLRLHAGDETRTRRLTVVR